MPVIREVKVIDNIVLEQLVDFLANRSFCFSLIAFFVISVRPIGYVDYTAMRLAYTKLPALRLTFRRRLYNV